MLIDCSQCVRQYTVACRDCVVAHLLMGEAGPLDIDAEHAEALGALADSGLVPRLRLLRAATG